jgi:flavin-dependent dehydrogenase
MNTPCAAGVYLAGDALRVTEPFTGQGIFFALRTAELAAEAIGSSRDYGRSIRQLYRQRGQTNFLLRKLLYHHHGAGLTIGLLHRLPGVSRRLAANVLAQAA